ncbi:unnamed protein product, partial [Mesorhabditis belari]|uniref:Uncharacterized protein n=1 Tax=Mesorhabditis belari TaxID=2138241 RepID=A0AAF3EWA8_9BILA
MCNENDEFSLTTSEEMVKFGDSRLPVKYLVKSVKCLKYQLTQSSKGLTIVGANGTTEVTSKACSLTGSATIPVRDGSWSSAKWTGEIIPMTYKESLFMIEDLISNRQFFPIYNGGLYAWQISQYDISILMHCDWDYCNNVTSLTSLLNQQTVECYSSLNSGGSMINCRAQACFIIYFSEEMAYLLGCFWQDSSKAQGRIEVGQIQITPKIYTILCAEDFCNQNPAAAATSIRNFNSSLQSLFPFVQWPQSILDKSDTTTSSSAHFPIDSTAFDSFFTQPQPISHKKNAANYSLQQIEVTVFYELNEKAKTEEEFYQTMPEETYATLAENFVSYLRI